MKKISYLIILLIQIVLLAVPPILNSYYENKMGVMRHILFMNSEFERQYSPLTLIRASLICFILLFLISFFFYFKKQLFASLFPTLQFLLLISSLIGTFYYALTHQTGEVPTYYFALLAYALITLLQLGVTLFISLKTTKKRTVK